MYQDPSRTRVKAVWSWWLQNWLCFYIAGQYYFNWYSPNDSWSLRSPCHHSNDSNQLPNIGRRQNHVADKLTPHLTLERSLWPKKITYKNQVPFSSIVHVVFGTSNVTFSVPWEVTGVKIIVPEKPIGTLDVANHWPMDTLIEPTAICM